MRENLRIRLGADDLRLQMILILLIIGISFIVAYVFLLLGIPGDDFILVYADDTQECILPQFCANIARMTQDDYIQILEIWNAAGCSTRDICTPATTKVQTCEEGDSDCLTSLPDPDYNKTIIAPQIQKEIEK